MKSIAFGHSELNNDVYAPSFFCDEEVPHSLKPGPVVMQNNLLYNDSLPRRILFMSKLQLLTSVSTD
mgnify:CR=1 FL=1